MPADFSPARGRTSETGPGPSRTPGGAVIRGSREKRLWGEGEVCDRQLMAEPVAWQGKGRALGLALRTAHSPPHLRLAQLGGPP